MTFVPNPVVVVYGTIQVVIHDSAGVRHDVTSFNGIPVIVKSIVSNEPFGEASAVVEFPQITPFQPPQSLWGGIPNIDIHIVKPDNSLDIMFEGFISSWESSTSDTGFTTEAHCLGALFELDFLIAPPPLQPRFDPIDIGTIITHTINNKPTRLAPINEILTGIKTLKTAGGGQPLLTGWFQDLLATAMESDGTQWTLMKQDGRIPILRQKDRTTVHQSITCGTPGVVHQLSYDYTGSQTTYYGDGLDPYGCFWRNTKYPNLHPDAAPVWPGFFLTVGPPQSTNATTAGSVTLWEQRMRDTGHTITVDGIYGADDRLVCINFQQTAGINVDGIVGPQTWAASFQVGSNQGSLDGVFYAPLYSDPRVETRLYNPDGSDAGPNPGYNAQVMRREKNWTSYGAGVSKAEGERFSRIQYNRDRFPAWLGTITLDSDPDEKSRFAIRAGQNLLYRGFAGNLETQTGGAVVGNVDPGGLALNQPVVGIAGNDSAGYWLVSGDGGVFTFGNAAFHGSLANRTLSAPIVGIASPKGGGGYWLVGADGGVFAENNGQPFGNVTFQGSLPSLGIVPNAPVVGIAEGPGPNSYYVASADGGVYAFDIPFLGSEAGHALSAPIVGIASTNSGRGYWLVGADGGVFAFGDAAFHGSLPGLGITPNAPIVGIVADPVGSGYWLVGADGGVYAPNADAPFHGSVPGSGGTASGAVVGMTSNSDGSGYWLASGGGVTYPFGTTAGSSSTPPVQSHAPGILFHISQVEKDFENLTVTLTVDEKARDLMTVAAIFQRNKEANDPSLRLKPYHMNSVNTVDVHPIFDCESGAGLIPRQGIFAGLWNVIHIPASASGSIQNFTLHAEDTAALLAIGFWDRAITANEIAGHGNPYTNVDFWKSFGADTGLIIGWGSQDQPAGFSPGLQSEGDPATGDLIDNATWFYKSTQPPWLWVAIYSSVTTYVSGTMTPAVSGIQ